ncbi:hypothetical protein ACFX14_040810 [Malus domestica]
MKLMVHKSKENEWAFATSERVAEMSIASTRPGEDGSLFRGRRLQPRHCFVRPHLRAHLRPSCKSLSFTPAFPDPPSPDLSFVIFNLAFWSVILSWCHKSSVNPPKPLDFATAEKIFRASIGSRNETKVPETPRLKLSHSFIAADSGRTNPATDADRGTINREDAGVIILLHLDLQWSSSQPDWFATKEIKEDTEAWGVEPYDLENVDASCKSLVSKGNVRAADIKLPLP